jgi:precorrin-2/cobalt-factor-2 C20-methyltransferase
MTGSAALNILESLTDLAGKEILPVEYPLTTNRTVVDAFWRECAATLVERVSAGEDVGYCTIGDPLIYSTWGHLIGALRGRSIPLVTLPGVSSVSLAAARFNLPLADQEGGYTVCAASDGIDRIADAIDRSGCTVIMKIGKAYGDVASLIRDRGLLPFTLFVQRVGTTRERIERGLPCASGGTAGGDIGEPGGEDPGPMSLIIVRKEGNS